MAKLTVKLWLYAFKSSHRSSAFRAVHAALITDFLNLLPGELYTLPITSPPFF